MARIQFRRDTSANWGVHNPILASGEVGFEIDVNMFKLGDGLTPWNSLGYSQSGGVTTLTTFSSVVDAINAGDALLYNSNKYTSDYANYEISTLDNNFIIETNGNASVGNTYLCKSSNLWLLNIMSSTYNGIYYTSADGMTWSKRVCPLGAGSTSVSYLAVSSDTSTYFVCAMSGNTTGYLSSDGVTWSTFTFSSPIQLTPGNSFSFGGTLYIPDNATPTTFHRITTSYLGATNYPTCGRTASSHGILARTGVGVMIPKDTTGEAGYTFTSDMVTFTAYTYPFEPAINTVLSAYYDIEKSAFVFISYGSQEAYTSTNLINFTRAEINIYAITPSITKYSPSGVPMVNVGASKYSTPTRYSQTLLLVIGSPREKHRLMANGNMPLAIGLRRNHTNNQTELVLLGKKFNWETDNVKFPIDYKKL